MPRKINQAKFDKYMKEVGWPAWRKACKKVDHEEHTPTKRVAKAALAKLRANYYPSSAMMPHGLVEFLDWIAFEFGLKKTKKGDYK